MLLACGDTFTTPNLYQVLRLNIHLHKLVAFVLAFFGAFSKSFLFVCGYIEMKDNEIWVMVLSPNKLRFISKKFHFATIKIIGGGWFHAGSIWGHFQNFFLHLPAEENRRNCRSNDSRGVWIYIL